MRIGLNFVFMYYLPVPKCSLKKKEKSEKQVQGPVWIWIKHFLHPKQVEIPVFYFNQQFACKGS